MNVKGLARIATLVLLVGALSATVVVTAAAEPARATKQQAVGGSVKLLHSTAQRNGWELILKNFARVYPNVKVETQYVGGGAVGQNAALLPQLQAGSGPDIFVTYPGDGVPPSVTDMQQAGYAASLAGRPWVKRDPAWIRSLTNVGGKPYMLELGVQVGAILYNTNRFSQLGLKTPTTFSQLLAICRTIRQKEPNTIPIAYTGGFLSLNGAVMMTMTASDLFSKDPTWNTKRAQGKVKFAGSAWRHSLQKLLTLKESGCFSNSVAADDVAAVARQLGSGQAVMTIANSSTWGQTLLVAPNVKWSVFAMPGDTAAQTRLLVYPASGISVNAKSQNKEAAFALLDFAARPKQADVFNRADGYGQIAPFNFDKGVWPDLYKPLLPYAKKTVPYPVYYWGGTGPYLAVSQGIVGLLTGQKSVDQVLADMDAGYGK